ncbi:MAG: A24 family peptidase [Oscillospiraceae bacterium]
MIILNIFLLLILIYAAIKDCKYLIIPNSVPIAITFLAIIKNTITRSFGESLFAVTIIAIPIFVLAVLTDGIGGGDVKVIASICLFYGFWNSIFVLTISLIMQLIYMKTVRIKSTFFAPFLLVGCIAMCFFY